MFWTFEADDAAAPRGPEARARGVDRMPKAASEILAPSAHASPPLLQAWLFQDVRSMPPPASGPHALLGALAWAGGLLRILAIAYSAKRPAAANQAGAAASSQSSALATSLTCRDAGSPARPSRRAPDACARRANSGPAGTCRSSSRIAIGSACHWSRDSRRPHSSSLWAYGERQPAICNSVAAAALAHTSRAGPVLHLTPHREAPRRR